MNSVKINPQANILRFPIYVAYIELLPVIGIFRTFATVFISFSMRDFSLAFHKKLLYYSVVFGNSVLFLRIDIGILDFFWLPHHTRKCPPKYPLNQDIVSRQNRPQFQT